MSVFLTALTKSSVTYYAVIGFVRILLIFCLSGPIAVTNFAVLLLFLCVGLLRLFRFFLTFIGTICSLGDMITDPNEQGDFVPEGLLGEDAMCFDIDQYDDTFIQYVEARLDEAHQSAVKGSRKNKFTF